MTYLDSSWKGTLQYLLLCGCIVNDLCTTAGSSQYCGYICDCIWMTWLYFELGLLHAFLVFLGASLCIEMKIAIRSPDFPPLNSRPVPIANRIFIKNYSFVSCISFPRGKNKEENKIQDLQCVELPCWMYRSRESELNVTRHTCHRP